MTGHRNFVDVSWLAQRLDDPSIVIADCRFDLTDAAAGRAAFDEGHIPGAVYLDLEQDLSGPKGAHGGRHPLPDPDTLARTLGAVGIDETVTVIAYDDPAPPLAPAARLWWLLRFLGHDRARVLEGGWPAWRAAGLRMSREPAHRAPRRFVPRPRPEMAAGVETVRRMIDDPNAALVDSRAPERYRGDVEPIDPVAGHIPGAVNLPWTETRDAEGRMRPRGQLAEQFAALRGRDVVVYCGSGVTACANLLALDEAGLGGARLYVGSWSDWCSYPDNPVATGSDAEEERKG
jgi:thiosulfate/3-mercaptopyruvate sulfurtransferase